MKVVKKTANELIIAETGFSVRGWGVLIFVLSSFGLYGIQKEIDKMPDRIPLIVASCFWIAGLLAIIFVRHKLTYIFNKENDLTTFIYPEIMGISKSVKTFKTSSIDSISNDYKTLLSEAVGRVYEGSSFFLKLKDGQIIESNIYSSDHKEIDKVVKEISDFCKISLKNEE